MYAEYSVYRRSQFSVIIMQLGALTISTERYLAGQVRGVGRRAGSMQRAIPYMVTKTHVLCDWSSRQQSRVGTAR